MAAGRHVRSGPALSGALAALALSGCSADMQTAGAVAPEAGDPGEAVAALLGPAAGAPVPGGGEPRQPTVATRGPSPDPAGATAVAEVADAAARMDDGAPSGGRDDPSPAGAVPRETAPAGPALAAAPGAADGVESETGVSGPGLRLVAAGESAEAMAARLRAEAAAEAAAAAPQSVPGPADGDSAAPSAAPESATAEAPADDASEPGAGPTEAEIAAAREEARRARVAAMQRRVVPAPAQVSDLPEYRARGATALSLGLALLRADQPDRAHAAFVRALRSGRHRAAALAGAGLAAERQGLMTRARDYFEAAAELAPESDTVQNNLGVVLYRLGQYGAAHRAFRTAFALSSGRNRAAERNMLRAAAAVEARTRHRDPDARHAVERRGDSEYVLVALPREPEETPAP